MYSTYFFVVSVIVGILMLSTVMANYVRNIPVQNLSVTLTITVLGFVLVSSPLWSSVSVKGEDFEIIMLREIAVEQIKTNIANIENEKNLLSSEAASRISPKIESLKKSLQKIEGSKGSELTSNEMKALGKVLTKTFEVRTETFNAGVEG